MGGNLTFGIYNTNSQFGLGVGLTGEYQNSNLPIIFRFSAKTYHAQFEAYETPIVGNTHAFESIEVNILYFPFGENTRTYVGLGLGYNYISMEPAGNAIDFENKLVMSTDPENTLSYNVFLGTYFFPEKIFSFFLELQHRFINISYTAELLDGHNNKSTIDRTLSVNNILLNFGFRVRLYKID